MALFFLEYSVDIFIDFVTILYRYIREKRIPAACLVFGPVPCLHEWSPPVQGEGEVDF